MRQKYRILIIVLAFVVYGCSEEIEREKYAKLIIEKVEKFKTEKNRLPKNLSEIGLTEREDSKAFYEQKNDSTYIVWFGLSLGESKTYDSKTKEWTKGG